MQLIGTYLLSVLTGPSPSADSMVAALNGIFDIYADETAPWDVEVFRKGGFLEGLKSSVSKVRAIVRPTACSCYLLCPIRSVD